MPIIAHAPRIFAVLLALCLGLASFPASAGPATILVERFNLAFVDIMRMDDRLAPAGQPGRYRRLSDHFGEYFDLQAMMEQAAGAQWARASTAERTQAVDAFLRLSVSTYLSRFESYAGEYFETLGEEPERDGNVRVLTRLVRPGRINIAVSYIVRPPDPDADGRIVDVILIGGASEVATRKSEFAYTLSQRGLKGLTARLNDQADKIIADLGASLQRDAAQRTYASTN